MFAFHTKRISYENKAIENDSNNIFYVFHYNTCVSYVNIINT